MSSAMDNLKSAQQRAAAQRPEAAGFPYLAEVLRQAGVRRYQHFVPSASSLYLTETGPVITQAAPIVADMAEVAPWDREGLIAALRTDQAGKSTFEEFAQSCWAAGVVQYEVDLVGRTCTYSGTTGEQYVESYPEVEVC